MKTGAFDEAVARARSGDAGAFEAIYRELAGPLLTYLATQVRRRDDAEDLVGQVFVEAIRGIARFKGDGGAFRAWLFRIARDRAVDLARRQDRRPEDPLEAAAERPDPTATEHEAIRRVENQRLWAAVNALPPKQREVVALRLGSGLSSTEIARVLGKRVGAVKALQHRAIANLARALGVEEAPEEAEGVAGEETEVPLEILPAVPATPDPVPLGVSDPALAAVADPAPSGLSDPAPSGLSDPAPSGGSDPVPPPGPAAL